MFEVELGENQQVCRSCGYHVRLSTAERMALVVDEGSFVEHDSGLTSNDPLKFSIDKKNTPTVSSRPSKKCRDRVTPMLRGHAPFKVIPSRLDFLFLNLWADQWGRWLAKKSLDKWNVPLNTVDLVLCFCASGGARMQEGVLSLVQMAKTAAARAKLKEAAIPYIPVLLDPTTGGVAASVAMFGDITIAEPNALIGFAGPRVIEQTIGQQLPEGFQRSEFLLEHGLIDMIVPRTDLKDALSRVLRWFAPTKNC